MKTSRRTQESPGSLAAGAFLQRDRERPSRHDLFLFLGDKPKANKVLHVSGGDDVLVGRQIEADHLCSEYHIPVQRMTVRCGLTSPANMTPESCHCCQMIGCQRHKAGGIKAKALQPYKLTGSLAHFQFASFLVISALREQE